MEEQSNKIWENLSIDCWNYLKGCVGGQLKRVMITKERYCNSNCENSWCPLYKGEN